MPLIRIWKTYRMTIVKGAMLACLLVASLIGYARLAGYELMSVQSDSMSPSIHKGDAVLVNTRNPDPQVGEIVSFQSPINAKLVITHRVIGVDNHRGMIETRGDNTSLVDTPIPTWNVIGKVTRTLPKVGFVLSLLKNPLGLVAVIYLPALGIIIGEVSRLARYYATGVNPSKRVHYQLRPGYAPKLS
jgi:signal peptidase I